LADTYAIPRAQRPEEAGISGAVLTRVVGDLLGEGLELHSIMVLRHGLVAYEDFRAPYGPEDPHTLFSVSKSITSIAAGFAIEEGLLRLEDKVADIVPELRAMDRGGHIEQLKVVHLLRMCAGKEVSILANKQKLRWIRDYAKARWAYAPGEGWHYCNENCYMLCVIISRLAGCSVTDFLMPRLFEPLGIKRPFWETDGRGAEAGGWGLYLKTEDLAKLGLCYLDGGKYRGRQVIPPRWVRESGRKQAGGDPGYGYCFWMNPPPGGFRMDGMFGQFSFILPEYDACVVTTAGELHMGKILNAVFRYLPDLFLVDSEQWSVASDVEIPKLPAYPPIAAAPRNPALEARLEGRAIRFPALLQRVPKLLGFPLSMMPGMAFFMSADKAGGIDRLSFRFLEDSVALSWTEGRERNTVLCGMDGRARKSEIALGGAPFTMSCSAAWEGDSLLVRLRCLNSVAERRLAFRFRGRGVYMLPRSGPDLQCLVSEAESFCAYNVPSKLLGKVITRSAAQLLVAMEPPHIGCLE